MRQAASPGTRPGAEPTPDGVRVLRAADLPALRALLDRDPVTNVFVDARVRAYGVDPLHLGAQFLGYHEDGRLVSACYTGANVVPVEVTPRAVDAFASWLLARPRVCSSIWGPRDAVAALWERLRFRWGPARDIRGDQPFLTLTRPAAVPPDPAVRPVRAAEFGSLYPASVAFFVEELGVSPELPDGGRSYRARVSDLVARRRAYARFHDGRIVFKAEIGVETSDAFQIQGVWVAPDHRGRGLAAPAMAAVVAAGLADVAPVATLYVNDFNTPARRAYDAVGFVQRSTFMTVLF